MVLFKNHNNNLVILSSKDEDVEKGLSLPIDRSITGPFSPNFPNVIMPLALKEWYLMPTNASNPVKATCLQSSIHAASSKKEKFETLRTRIVSNTAFWGPSFRILGEINYFPKYWEWTEDILFRYREILHEIDIEKAVFVSLYTYDWNKNMLRAFCENWCPTTNTLHTATGEASISFWDLHKLSGLPLHGSYYDEAIPCMTELTRKDNLGLNCCEYLFGAFHYLSSLKNHQGGVLVTDWINFWFRGELHYKKPPPRRIRTSGHPGLTHNHTELFSKRQSLASQLIEVFNMLGVPEDTRAPTYLTAFLSCWLCIFVLPSGNVELLRPETFKIASIMASRRKPVNLFVPVLAKIYHGLNQIANSTQAGLSNACFPIHYVFGWMTYYYDTHYPLSKEVTGPLMVKYSGEEGAKHVDGYGAREIIHSTISWNALSFLQE